MSPKDSHKSPESAQFATAVDNLKAAAQPILETDSFSKPFIETLYSEVLEAQTAIDGLQTKLEGAVPVGAYGSDLITYAYKIEAPGNPVEYPALDPENDVTFNLTLEYLLHNLGVPIETGQLLGHLRKNNVDIPNKPWAIAALGKLVRRWKPELAEFLKEEGIGGKWGTLNRMPVFAPNQRDAALQEIISGIESRTKAKPANRTFEDEEVRAIWQDDDNTSFAVKSSSLETEDKLSSNEKALLAYLSDLSVRSEVEYPSQDKLVDRIVEASKRQNLSPGKVQLLINNLVEQEFLFVYRSGGKSFVTTNANVAVNKRLQRKEGGKSETKTKPEQKVDLDLSAELVEILVGLEANEQKYTIQKLWAQLQHKKGVTVHHQKPTGEEVEVIRSTAQGLADLGIFFAGNYKAQTKGARHSARRTTFKIGFASNQYRFFKDMDAAQRKEHLEERIGPESTH